MNAFLSAPPIVIAGNAGHRSQISWTKTITKRPDFRPCKVSHRVQRQCVPTAVATPMTKDARDQLVDTLLFFVRDTDRGARVTSSEREAIDTLIDQLCDSVADKPLTSDLRLFDDYAVVYSVNSSKQKTPAVGGLFRTWIGKLIFGTRGLFENLVSPNIVVNLLCFRFLGFIRGNIALRGKMIFAPDGPEKPNDLRFEFARPRLRIGPAVFEYGPCPRIGSELLYLDDRIRITVGKRGSRFIFVRREPNEMPEADEWKTIFDAKPLPTLLLPLSFLACIGISLLAPLPIRIGALILLSVLFFLLRTGGTGSDPSNVPSKSTT